MNEIFLRLLPLASYSITKTVNVDCTILLALVSDLSHYDTLRILREAEARNPSKQLKPVIIRQMQNEVEEQLLQNVLYPLLKDHELVCTKEAAVRMREVVNTLGTVAEKERTAIFMGDLNLPIDELHQRLNALSIHTTPKTLRLPIRTVCGEVSLSHLPSVAETVVDHFSKTDTSSVTRSVFLYGYVSNPLTQIDTLSARKVLGVLLSDCVHYCARGKVILPSSLF